jgi:hypothetical protein
MEEQQDYQPYGEQWEAEVNKFPKKQIVEMLKKAHLSRQQLIKPARVIELLNNELAWARNEKCNIPAVNDGSENAYFDGVILGLAIAKKKITQVENE